MSYEDMKLQLEESIRVLDDVNKIVHEQEVFENDSRLYIQIQELRSLVNRIDVTVNRHQT